MAEEKDEKIGNVDLYSNLDRDRYGNIASEFPAWYFETHLDNMKEELNSIERRLERGAVSQEEQPYARAEMERLKEKIRSIEKSKPQIKDGERTTLQKCYRELAGKIQDSMFTYSEMMMGTANANEEARRMVNPCIGLSASLKTLAKTCNVKMAQGGTVSRNGAIKIWKIIGKLINEGTNVESLRRDKATTLTGA